MELRRAIRDDLVSIARLADAAHWEIYAGLVKPDTIAQILHNEYSPSALKRRLLSGGVVVADSGVDAMGFGDADVHAAFVGLRALSVEPESRRGGIGSALLGAVRDLDARLPVCADVLLGDLGSEHFLEARGFSPGEILHQTLYGEDVVGRRWWLPAM